MPAASARRAYVERARTEFNPNPFGDLTERVFARNMSVVGRSKARFGIVYAR